MFSKRETFSQEPANTAKADIFSGELLTGRVYNQNSMRSLGTLLCALPLLGQSVRVSSVSAAPEQAVSIEIGLESPAGKEPVALQWDIEFPGTALKLDSAGIVAGGAAQTAGKTLTCASKQTDNKLSKRLCILVGGTKPIGNGVVAVLHFEVQARSGSHLIVADNILGVSPANKKIPIARAEGVVRVKR